MRTSLVAVAFGSLVAGCTASGPELAEQRAAVVFGEDGRQDYYEALDPGFATLLRDSTVAIVEPAYIDLSDPNAIVPNTVTLGEYQNLCDGQRYAAQPAMASCSGALIDDDLVLTAGHCIDDAFCKQALFVFGFYMTSASELHPLTSRDVYRCAEVLVRRDTVHGDVWHDDAIVRLDRPVEGGRKPARVVMEPDAARVGQRITALGFGDGIPGKVHTGATVNATLHDQGYFMGSTDTFAGNSGSATYTAQHEILGVYVRGTESDYVDQGSCQVVNVAKEPRAKQEYSYAYRAVRELCDSGYPSERLCGSEDPVPDATGDADAGASPDAGDPPSERAPDAGSSSDGEPTTPSEHDAAGASDADRGKRNRHDAGCQVRLEVSSADPSVITSCLLALLATRRRLQRASRSRATPRS